MNEVHNDIRNKIIEYSNKGFERYRENQFKNFTLNAPTIAQIHLNPENFLYCDKKELCDEKTLYVYKVDEIDKYVTVVFGHEIDSVEELDTVGQINAKYHARKAEDFSFILTDCSEFEEETSTALYIIPTWTVNLILKNITDHTRKSDYIKFSSDTYTFTKSKFDLKPEINFITHGGWIQTMEWYQNLMNDLDPYFDYSRDGIEFYVNADIDKLYQLVKKYNLQYSSEFEKHATKKIPLLTASKGYFYK